MTELECVAFADDDDVETAVGARLELVTTEAEGKTETEVATVEETRAESEMRAMPDEKYIFFFWWWWCFGSVR